jgi:hypothetical protein
MSVISSEDLEKDRILLRSHGAVLVRLFLIAEESSDMEGHVRFESLLRTGAPLFKKTTVCSP